MTRFYKLIPILFLALSAVPALAVDPTSVSVPTALKFWLKAGTGGFTDTGGTTPVSSNGDAVARANDQSGNGNNVTQSTAANRPKWDATNGYIVSEYGNRNQWFTFPTVSAITNRNSTVVFIGQLTTLRDTNSDAGNVTAGYIFGSDAFTLCTGYVRGGFSKTADGVTNRQDTATILRTSPMCWIFSNSGAATTVYVNGDPGSIGAMASNTWTSGILSGLTGGTNPLQARIKDICIYNTALNASDCAILLQYAQTRGVPTASVVGNVVIDGDSISSGYANNLNLNWVNQLSVSGSTRINNFSEASITLATLNTEAATVTDPWIQAGKTNVLIIFAGSNDIIIGGASAATAYSRLQTRCSAARTAGYNKIIVGTMLPRTGLADDSIRTTFNTSIKNGFANQTLACDAVADCGGDANIGQAANASDTTKYPDGTHPSNSTSTVIAGYFQTALYSVLPSSNPVQAPKGPNHIGLDLSIGLSRANDSDIIGRIGFAPNIRYFRPESVEFRPLRSVK